MHDHAVLAAYMLNFRICKKIFGKPSCAKALFMPKNLRPGSGTIRASLALIPAGAAKVQITCKWGGAIANTMPAGDFLVTQLPASHATLLVTY